MIFVLIVLYVFRVHSKRVDSQLRETRIEFSDFQRRKYSYVTYADVRDNYDDPNLTNKSNDYEAINYDEVGQQKRYQLELHTRIDQPEYLYMFSAE